MSYIAGAKGYMTIELVSRYTEKTEGKQNDNSLKKAVQEANKEVSTPPKQWTGSD